MHIFQNISPNPKSTKYDTKNTKTRRGRKGKIKGKNFQKKNLKFRVKKKGDINLSHFYL